MKKFKRYLVTSALPYANGPVHIGHLAGVYIPSDIYTRYLRLRGADVISVCGSDEHGVPITIKARQEGVSPQDIVDKYHEHYQGVVRGVWACRSTSIRAPRRPRTMPRPHRTFSAKLYDEGKFIEADLACSITTRRRGHFLADRYIVGTCPQVRQRTRLRRPVRKMRQYAQRHRPDRSHKAPITGSTPVLRETKHWFLPLDRYEEFLRKWILDGHKEWKT